MPAPNPSTPFHVPTIDISAYLASPTTSSSPALREIIDRVRTACKTTGFFQITGHGIPKELQQGIFSAAKEYFKLPLEEKMKADSKKRVGHRGYDVLASQSYEEGVEADLKEGYYIGTDVPPTSPFYGRFFMGPNIWPPTSLLPTSTFQSPCEAYYRAIHALSFKILELVGATLVPPTATTTNTNENGNSNEIPVPPVFASLAHLNPPPACPLRLLHYPSAIHSSSPSDKPQYGASAHTDFGAITLLLQDTNPGLEVLDTLTVPGSSIWRPIDPNPDAYVVNIGDMISMVTGGRYKSSVHRVICKRRERERFSVVFFFDGCLDARLEAVVEGGKGGEGEGGVKTVEEHMLERMRMSYGSGGKDVRRDLEVESA